jgi:hypothetical protein
MEPTQRTCVPDPSMDYRFGHISAEGDRYPQWYVVNPPSFAGGPRYGKNDPSQYPHGDISYCMPQDSQSIQPAYNQSLVMRPSPVADRSAESFIQFEGTTQIELQIPRVLHATYTQQPSFVPPRSVAKPDMLTSNCHQIFNAEPQPQPGDSALRESPWEVLEQQIRTIFSEVKVGKLGGIADRLTNSLQYLQAHVENFGGWFVPPLTRVCIRTHISPRIG